MEKPRVLIVDDELILRESLSAWLEEDGFEVRACEEGMKAIEMAKNEHMDAAVLDIKMPGMDGITLLKKLLEIDKEMPVVMMTAHATVENAIQSMKDGAYDYIMKPFPPEKLSTVIRRIVENRQLIEENIRLKKERKQVLHMAVTALISLAALLVALYFIFGK